jgi:hypothetical protein
MDVDTTLNYISDIEKDMSNNDDFFEVVFKEFTECIIYKTNEDKNQQKPQIDSIITKIRNTLIQETNPEKQRLRAKLLGAKQSLLDAKQKEKLRTQHDKQRLKTYEVNDYDDEYKQGGEGQYSTFGQSYKYRTLTPAALRQMMLKRAAQQYVSNQTQSQSQTSISVSSFPLTNVVNENEDFVDILPILKSLVVTVNEVYAFLHDRNERVATYLLLFYLWSNTYNTSLYTGGRKKSKKQQSGGNMLSEIIGENGVKSIVDEGTNLAYESGVNALRKSSEKIGLFFSKFKKHIPSEELKDDAMRQGGKHLKKYIKSLIRENKLNTKAIENNKQTLQKEIESKYPLLWQIIHDYHGQPLYSQPFYLRRFVIRVVLKACFGQRYKMFGENKGFQFEPSRIFNMSRQQCNITLKDEEELSKNPQKFIQAWKDKHYIGDNIGFLDINKGQIFHGIENFMKLKKPDDMNEEDFRILLIIKQERLNKLIKCKLTSKITSQINSIEGEYTSANEDKDKETLVKTFNQTIEKNKELKEVKNNVVTSLRKMKNKVVPISNSRNITTNDASNPTKNTEMFGFVSNCLNEISQTVTNTEFIHTLGVIGNQILEFLISILPGPLVDFILTFGMLYIGLIELGINILIMIIFHMYSYYHAKSIDFEAKVLEIQRMWDEELKQNSSENNYEDNSSIISQSTNAPSPKHSSQLQHQFEKTSLTSSQAWITPNVSISKSIDNMVINPKPYTLAPIMSFNDTSQWLERTNALYNNRENPLFNDEDDPASDSSVVETMSLLSALDDWNSSDDLSLNSPNYSMNGGKKKISKKNLHDIKSYLQKFTKEELYKYARMKSYKVRTSTTKDDMINSIIKQHFQQRLVKK